MKSKIPHRNRSPYGWWIASFMERATWDKTDKLRSNRRSLVWENTILLKAIDREIAYKKATRFAKKGQTTFQDEKSGKTGRWIFLGLTSLLPIYEPLEDGSEILWNEYKAATEKYIASRLKQKKQLEAFDDSEVP